MTDAFQADRLTALQRLRGVSQQEMAAELDVSGPYLSQIKTGARPMSAELAHRASTAFKVPMSYFSVQKNPVDSMPVTFWKKARARARDEAQVVETYNEAIRLFRYASISSKYHEARLPDPQEHGYDVEAIAGAVRGSAGLKPTTPIRNMVRLCERLGIGVITNLDPDRSEAPGDHTGLSRPAEIKRPLIGIVGTQRGDTQRFTLAHEMFHLMADRDLEMSITSTRDAREHMAHAFAGALLLPEPIARQHLSESLTLHGYLRVKADYGLSVGALIMRGKELGLVSPGRVRSLFIQMSSLGWRKDEPVSVTLERPLLLGQALRRTHGKQYIARVSHVIGTPVELLRHWIPEDEMETDVGGGKVVQLRRSRG